MSGVIMLCGQQQFDPIGEPLVGGLVYMLQAGTVTPQNGFRDAALVNAYPNPIQLDASARIPVIYFADGTIRIRLTDAGGVTLFDFDNLPILGASSAGSIIDTTDPNARYNTGDLKIRYGTGALAGFVRANGLTIGPPSSGATERANADCLALFTYLWNLNDNIDHPITPSRGASAAADWAATSPFKQVKLPDFNGVLLGSLDGQGATSSRLTVGSFNGAKAPTVLGAIAGAESFTLTVNELPTHAHGYTEPNGGQGHLHGVDYSRGNVQSITSSAATVVFDLTAPGGGPLAQSSRFSPTGIVISNNGAGLAKFSVPPTRLISVYVRL